MTTAGNEKKRLMTQLESALRRRTAHLHQLDEIEEEIRLVSSQLNRVIEEEKMNDRKRARAKNL